MLHCRGAVWIELRFRFRVDVNRFEFRVDVVRFGFRADVVRSGFRMDVIRFGFPCGCACGCEPV